MNKNSKAEGLVSFWNIQVKGQVSTQTKKERKAFVGLGMFDFYLKFWFIFWHTF